MGFGGDKSPEAAANINERKRRLKRLRKTCEREVNEVIAPALRYRFSVLLPDTVPWSLEADEEDPDNQTLVLAYPRATLPGAADYLRPTVKLEFGARSDPWPVSAKPLTSIVAQALPDLFDNPVTVVRALQPERTFWEKVMLLHEEQFRPADKTRRPRMARHYYDLWRLIESGVAERAAADASLFARVARHREVYFTQTWMDYSTFRRGRIQPSPTTPNEEIWREDYDAMRTSMFVDDPPPFREILAAVRRFEEAFNRG